MIASIEVPDKPDSMGELTFENGSRSYVEPGTLMLLVRCYGSLESALGREVLYQCDKFGIVTSLLPLDAYRFGRAVEGL